jgi:tetratricopeptide (TPR) repeat protein
MPGAVPVPAHLPFASAVAALTLAALPVCAQPAPSAPVTQPAVASARTTAPSAEAYYEFLLGRHFESEGQVDDAIAAHVKAAALDPEAAELPAELASLYARLGRFKEAIASAEAALKIAPDNVEAHRVLGTIYASMFESRGDSGPAREDAARRAIEHLERGRRSDGTDADPGLDLALGRLYLAQNENERGLQVLRRLVEYQPEVGEAYLLIARAETALGHPDRAVATLEEAADDNPRLLSSLAELYEKQQRWRDAAGAYERLSARTPNSTDLKTRWATALLQSDKVEDAAKARDLLRDVVRAAPTDTRPLYLLSTAERRARDFAAAEVTARRLITLAPDGSSGAFALAQVYEDQRQFDKAADTLGPVVARITGKAGDPPREMLTLMAHLGFAQMQAGRADAAIATFEQARALAGGAGNFDTSLIQAHLLAKHYDRAAELARAAALRQPGDLRFAQLEARALGKAGRQDRAVVVMRDAVAAHTGDVQAYLSLAETLQDASRKEEADQVLADAEQRFPKDVTVPFQRGALLEQRKDYARAEAAFRDALARDPLHAPSLNYLGYMLAERGERLDEAVTLVERALTIDPENGSYLDSLGWALFKQKRYDRAEPLLRRAAAQVPANSVVQEHLGDVLWAMNRRAEAAEAWRHALSGDRQSIDVKAIEEKIGRAR